MLVPDGETSADSPTDGSRRLGVHRRSGGGIARGPSDGLVQANACSHTPCQCGWVGRLGPAPSGLGFQLKSGSFQSVQCRELPECSMSTSALR